MKQKRLTALICAFSRAYHTEHNDVRIFDDPLARLLLTDEEYEQISKSMADGIGFFNPSFTGTPSSALRWVMDHQCSPTPLGRSAFAEKALERAVLIGARQYLILGAGYDTFAYRQPAWAGGLQIFELDRPAAAQDKRERLLAKGIACPSSVHWIPTDFSEESWPAALTDSAAFHGDWVSFCSILGVLNYLSKQTVEGLFATLGSLLPEGSALAFDYPDQHYYTEQAGERAKKQTMLAAAANEKMRASYSYADMERALSAHGFLIYEHLTPLDMTRQFFSTYNQANPSHPMTAFDNTNYCLAVKKGRRESVAEKPAR